MEASYSFPLNCFLVKTYGVIIMFSHTMLLPVQKRRQSNLLFEEGGGVF